MLAIFAGDRNTAMIPLWAKVLFLFGVAWTLFFLYRSTRSWMAVAVASGWGLLHLLLLKAGFYADTTSLPPRPAALLAPMVLLILAMVLLPAGRRWMQRVDIMALVLLNAARIPVEIVLHEGWQAGLAPRDMTYAGLNYDIVSGITAVVLAGLLRVRPGTSRGLLIGWNLLCLALVLNIVVIAVLSIEGPLQRINFDQPNLLVLQSPYVLLPALVVPVVLWSHAAMLVKLLTRPSGKP